VAVAKAAVPALPDEPALEAMPSLAAVVNLAAQQAPEMELGRAALTASRASQVSARLAPVGNPLLEVTAQRGSRGVTRDVMVEGALWLPLEISGQRSSRKLEASDYIALHEVSLAATRASVMAQAVRAYGELSVAEMRYEVVSALVRDTRAEADFYAQRLERGDAIARDAAMASVEFAKNQVLLGESHADVLRYRAELRRLTGHSLTLTDPTFTVPPEFATQRFQQVQSERAPPVLVSLAEARYFASARERYRKEGRGPLSVGVIGGRGDYGEVRVGGGLSYALPFFRSNQVEQARAEAERVRALREGSIRREVIRARIAAALVELEQLRRALELLRVTALPAAERALAAAIETQRAGKADWLGVLVSRRDLSGLRLRSLELTEKGWLLLSELVEATGELP
jgi:cobalt-zinc-cadmium efflux system outer membrane protein